MTEMNEIEKVKSEIKVLEKKLSLLEEIENHKTPCEEAYRNVYGYYPKGRGNGVWTIADADSWTAFQEGYNAAKEKEPEELKTLYQMVSDNSKYKTSDEICDIVKEWMSQYTHNVMSGEYASGYEDCILVLEENLK
jgi:hypothetical protein